MKEQIISFETAQLAKEKGFNIKTQKFFLHKGIKTENVDTSKVRVNLNVASNPLKYSNWNKLSTRTSAPTQSLLRKWLREVYKIDIVVRVFEREDGSIYYEYNNFSKLIEEDWDDDTIGETYEEALEQGLQEALKLIKK